MIVFIDSYFSGGSLAISGPPARSLSVSLSLLHISIKVGIIMGMCFMLSSSTRGQISIAVIFQPDLYYMLYHAMAPEINLNISR